MIDIRVQRLPHGEGLPLPAYASAGAAGLDVVAAESPTLPPGGRHTAHGGRIEHFHSGWIRAAALTEK